MGGQKKGKKGCIFVKPEVESSVLGPDNMKKRSLKLFSII